MRGLLLLIVVALNVALSFVALVPGLVSFANPRVQDISCTHCAEPDTQGALLQAALRGQSQVISSHPSTVIVVALLAANFLFQCALVFWFTRPNYSLKRTAANRHVVD
jgi:hypothetical protein